MEITKQGQLPKDKVLSGKCGNCKTEFTCTAGEATQHESKDQRGECGGYNYTVKCPLVGCGYTVTIYTPMF